MNHTEGTGIKCMLNASLVGMEILQLSAINNSMVTFQFNSEVMGFFCNFLFTDISKQLLIWTAFFFHIQFVCDVAMVTAHARAIIW